MSSNNFDLKQIELMLHTIIEMLKNLNSEKRSSCIYTQKEILDLLSISPNTLKSWENRGLKRLEPPIEGNRTVYYHIDTILEFLSHN
ncbi:MerR family transcriptional regulator [Streptococcus sp. NM]|uniref:MerR family transcriptional regulator n=1 Tax=Streptococcus sp. NM TaxID=2292266 RepID=UPI000E267963|nr:MerR family transcriptional regulator [Streptococcus sp. NM]REK92373.1 MerR family transcriptional regulator [Streptococcus sp. NM]REK92922.1 MerR family transcriptional regulator [Streptococcus sp. NM]